MTRFLSASAAAALCLSAGLALAQTPPAGPNTNVPPPAAQQAPMQVKPVAASVYMIVGNGGNTTVVVGKDGLILVDTKNPGQAVYDELMAKVASISPLPVKEVVITHHHSDHSGNTSFFEKAGVPVVAHQAESDAVKAYNPPGNPPVRPVPPTVVYTDVLVINAGGIKAEAHHWGGGHTGGDTVVYFPAQKIVSSGDEVVATTPNLDSPFGGSLAGELKSLDAIAKLDFDYVIPGHGDNPISKADFLVYKQKWETFAERARAAVKAGVPKDQLLAAIKTDDLGWKITGGVWAQPARIDNLYAELSK